MITIAFSGAEGIDGRALTLISAFHLAADGLKDCRLVAIGGEFPDVDVALEVLAHDTGLSVERLPQSANPRKKSDWTKYDLFVGVVRRRYGHLPIKNAMRAGVPLLIAIESRNGPGSDAPFLPSIYASDTRALAHLIAIAVSEIRASGNLSQARIEQLAVENEPREL